MLEKITEQQLAENGVVSAPDKLEGDPKDNKAVFDRLVTQLVAGVVNQIIEAHNALDVDVNGRIDAVLDELRNHVDVDPGNITAQNVGLLRELADKYGLTDKQAPTVHDALEVLEPLVARVAALADPSTFLSASTTARLPVVVEDPNPDDALLALAQTQLDSFTGGLLITAKYASTGAPAKEVYFTGLPSLDAELCKTDEHGEFFAAVSPGAYTLKFPPMVGQGRIEDKQITVEPRKFTRIDLTLYKSEGLDTFTTSGSYVVGEDATTMMLCAVGGGASGASYFHSTSTASSANYAILFAGAGGGFVSEAEFDLTQFRGQKLTVAIGAGGAKSSYSTDEEGKKGGTTTVRGPNGEVLLTGAGGEAASEGVSLSDYPDLTPTDPSRKATAKGGAGQGQGVGITLTATYDTNKVTLSATYTDATVGGAHIFGREELPVVSRGGSAAYCSRRTNVGNIIKYSPTGVQVGEELQPGDASPCVIATAQEDLRAGLKSGANGAVFIMYAEV